MKLLHKYSLATAGVMAVALVTALAGWSTPSKSPAAVAIPKIDIGVGKITPHSTKRIAYFVQASQAYSYTVVQAKAAQARGKQLGVRVDIFWSNLNPALELSNFNQVISGGKYGGIIIQPVTAQLCGPVRKLALKYQVVVLVVGNALCDDGTGSGAKLWAPGTVGYIGGQNNVPAINKVLATAANLNTGPQKALLVMGIQGHPSVVAWETAWKSFQAAHANWQLVSTVYTDFTSPGAFTATENALGGNKDVTAIFSPYIDITAGVVKAVAARGLEKQISIYENGGGSATAYSFVKSGQLAGDLPVYPGSLGTRGVEVMVSTLKGKQPPRFIDGDGNPAGAATGVVTKANAASFKPQW